MGVINSRRRKLCRIGLLRTSADTRGVGIRRALNYLDATSRIEAMVTFDPEITTDIQSFLLKLSSVPLGNLICSIRSHYRYGYIGMKDRMMYPLIMPGAIVQIDERRKRIVRGSWHHESERPIYFLEMRTGFACCWCAVEDGNIILQPHPLSSSHMLVLHLNEVDVIGQVVAVAMRLGVFADTPREP